MTAIKSGDSWNNIDITTDIIIFNICWCFHNTIFLQEKEKSKEYVCKKILYTFGDEIIPGRKVLCHNTLENVPKKKNG